MSNAIVWFRYDLRLKDNPALWHAAKNFSIIPLYIWDDTLTRTHGEAQKCWLHESLQSLHASLVQLQAVLTLRKGNPKDILEALVKQYKVKALFFNLYYEPEIIKRDHLIKNYFIKNGVEVHSYQSYLMSDPGNVVNSQGNPFKIFTPFWNKISKQIVVPPLLEIPSIHQNVYPTSDDLNNWQLLPSVIDWSKKIRNIWKPSEKAALKQLNLFINNHLHHYANQRDKLDIFSTSRLSPFLHFGEISSWQVVRALKKKTEDHPSYRKSVEKFMRQLGWREFCYYLIYHFPYVVNNNFKTEFDYLPWENNKNHLQMWQKGLTGYPIIDAGMNELWATGYMHNRVRMIVASFLTKNLMVDWKFGERWFWDTLVDADIANNVINWQWVAGCGPDASPYFRIFNPILQSKKFDSKGIYIKKWLPVLSTVPVKYIHEPWKISNDTKAKASIKLGIDYPIAIVDYNLTRKKALLISQQLKNYKKLKK